MAVAAFKVSHQRGNDEKHKHYPNDDRDVRRFLESLQEVFPARVHHVEISVDRGHGEEEDAGAAVQKQHEEHRFADVIVFAPPLSINEVMGLDWQAEKQQNVRQHQVEKKNVVAVGFPELELGYEEVEDHGVQRQSQDKNHNHYSGVEVIQPLEIGTTVIGLI